MLEKHDVQFIKDNHREVALNRLKPVTLHRRVKSGTDPLTGDATYKAELQPAEATWVFITTQSEGNAEVEYVNGVRVESGDAIANFDISYTLSDVRDITYIPNGETYRIKTKEAIGIGEPNRHHLLVDKVT